jgi:hypothetical protein
MPRAESGMARFSCVVADSLSPTFGSCNARNALMLFWLPFPILGTVLI